jgi:hypothetical protein
VLANSGESAHDGPARGHVLEFTPMPRRSAAAVDFMPLTAEHDRPPPPEGMPEPQAVIWRKTVASMRATWFTPECHDLLSRYCGAMAEAARLEAELPCVNVGDPLRGRVLSQYDLMAKLALAYGRALRLTPKANRVSTSDGRDPRRSNYPKPWEL